MIEFEHHLTAMMENKLCPTEARFFRLGPEVGHRVELLGQPLSQKNVFENSGPEPGKYMKRSQDEMLPNIISR